MIDQLHQGIWKGTALNSVEMHKLQKLKIQARN